MNNKRKENCEELEKALMAVGKMVLVIGTILWEGVKRLREASAMILTVMGCLVLLSFSIGHSYHHLQLLYWGDFMSAQLAKNIAFWGRVPNGLMLVGIFGGIALFAMGFFPYFERARLARALSRLGIKVGMDCAPKLLKVRSPGEHRQSLTIASGGVGISHYQKRQGDIEAAFNSKVESIRVGRSPKFVEITLTTKSIPAICYYHKLKDQMTDHYSFVVGESLNGTITKSILDFPGGHLLIAGTTGGGKSNWFKATLLSLLETSPFAEFFLFDFKGGVEFGGFGRFANVSVEKDMQGGLRKLRMIVTEMEHRFKHLEKVGRQSIDPTKDKMNHLFICVDEASLLYGKVNRSDPNFENVMEARSLTHDIAKRGRAARISLILATQKITKETIDTAIQENITGRICFRMNTLQGSMVVLGGKQAMELPDIAGRGIWQCGNEQVEVQAALLKERDIKKALEEDRTQEFFPLLEQQVVNGEQIDGKFLQGFEA